MSALDCLIAAAGTWMGTNTLHDPQTGQAEDSPSTLQVTPVLEGRFVRLDYTWGYQGRPQQGSLLLGFDPKNGEVSGHWIDSWHMGRTALACAGSSPAAGAFTVNGSYPAPTGPDWGWRIEVAVADDGLRITHTNLDSDGVEYPAVEASYGRS